MLVAVLVFWVLALVLGFALVYYDALERAFALPPELEAGFDEALYVSFTTLSTLGYGDVRPIQAPYTVLASVQALLGFGLLTLTISYLLGVYRVLQQLGSLATRLYHGAHGSTIPERLVAGRVTEADRSSLRPHVAELHHELVELYEGMRRYPIAGYFASRQAYRTWPYAFAMVSGAAAALAWGLPAGHPARREPDVEGLLYAVTDISERLRETLPGDVSGVRPAAVRPSHFSDALATGATSDPFVRRFLSMDARMRELGATPAPDPEEAYERYCGWLGYAARRERFLEAAATQLGYPPDTFAKEG